ncbi:Eco57I restriction-modification methylase domain-containing protein [Paenibacillus radicis (ex Gao et al. 2016)]|uniref:site-specific DNA-methyltransferase (adenine-specific) n=1 Tax=Paenibacillus radicis (ex Gao et al. 2016) TaxID=1737354 RepID=A0A917HL09_9BACL|nr:N-6 DNA methylase [Paenibacillus radicis (ex Gao et al. 2016)]GGG81975.1 SAM-dependent methyltransferase [Paenibacillus radicis (ex Gao et al. 2016)]
MIETLTTALIKGISLCITEEEVRLLWLSELKNGLNINFQSERERNDAYYNGVIIEFKNVGLFGGKVTSPAFKEAIQDRLKKYIFTKSVTEGLDPSDYIGIATDGVHVAFAHIKNNDIQHGHLMPINSTSIALVVEAIRGSQRRAVTAENLIDDFGHSSNSGATLMQALANALSDKLMEEQPNKIKMLFEEWRNLYGQVADFSNNQVDGIVRNLGFTINGESSKNTISAALFVIHTYNSLIIKLLGAEIVSSLSDNTAYKGFAESTATLEDRDLINRINTEIEKGEFFSRANIVGFVEEAIFSWYIDACLDTQHGQNICFALRNVFVNLAMYRTDKLTTARSRDVLKYFYQDLVPDHLRKSLGEFYTPDWLVEVALDKVDTKEWTNKRFLDPTCGSGSFLLAVIKRIRIEAETAGWSPSKQLEHITANVWGFDLNPLAVQAARVNLLISVSDLIDSCPGVRVELPVLLADAVYSPARNPDGNEDIIEYTIGSQIANLQIKLPSALALNRIRLDQVFSTMSEMVEKDANYPIAEKKLLSKKQITLIEAESWREALSETYNRVLQLHRQNWNGIWFRIVRNFFWSATAGSFDVIIGNPPWVRWSKLPELYRQRVMPTCREYEIFSSTPHHGGNELDISAMISYTVSDKWLRENGRLVFLVTQSLFQSPSSEGFRKFKIKGNENLIPKSVDDLKALRPFPDAANKTAIFVADKHRNVKPKYPLPYFVWVAAAGAKKVLPVALDKSEALKRVVISEYEATPVGGEGSPWSILPKGEFSSMKHLIGNSSWVQGRKGVTVDLNGIYFVRLLNLSVDGSLVQIETRPHAGKTDIGPQQIRWIEPEFIYPLLKGASDFSACYVHPKEELFVLVPNRGIVKEAYSKAEAKIDAELPKTAEYFKSFESLLRQRSTYRLRMKNAPYFAIYNVGDYTFSPWKVIWAEQKDFCAAVVTSTEIPGLGERVYIPDHKIFFVDFTEPEPAYFLCGLLNTTRVKTFVESHVIKTQIGNVFKHLVLPEFDSSNSNHRELAIIVKEAHQQSNSEKREKLLERINILGKLVLQQ